MKRSRAEMQQEIDMLRSEIKVAREAAEITADFVVRQFEQTEQMLHRFQSADAERQAVLDAATQLSIIATDLDGTIQLFSKGASTLLGYRPTEMIGERSILSLHLASELEHYGKKVSSVTGAIESGLHNMKVFDQFVKQKRSRAQEWIYVCKNGTHLPVSLSVTSLHNPDGRLVGYLFTAMDMTLHKQMERELIEAKDLAESANTSKGDFLARMSHEIRTPMNGVIGMASLLQKTALEPRQRNYTEKLLTSANTLLRLINDILDFSKIDAGKLQLEEVAFSLEDILGNIVNVIGMQAEKKGLELIFRIDPQVTNNLIGDPLRLGQVLMNLAGNAVKFTEQGEIVISVLLEHRAESELTLRFSVRDSGIGLHPEQLDHLFSAFSQADDSITRKYGGTGLGLAICKQLTELMEGKIWVESELGVGTEFIFTAKLQAAGNSRSPAAPPVAIFTGLRALVVDDNEAARDVLSAMLSSFAIEVETAVNGKMALSFLEKAVQQERPYDVILLDWIMPGIDGIETARRIKAHTALAKVPAMLMVTANGREEAYLEAEKVGLNAFLLKPVYASVMYDTLLDILDIDSVPVPRQAGEQSQIPDLDKIRGACILLVDDNSINQEVATAFLEDAGMVVTVASTGPECLAALERENYELVLMDIQMPVMDGLEVTRRIRRDHRFKDLPIIAMTAHAMAGDREKSLAAGMNDHLTKPIDQLALYQTLKAWIKETRPRPESTDSAGAANISQLDYDSLPPLPGIDQAAALRALSQNKKLLVKMLYDFKKHYSSFPAELRQLSVTGRWLEIQDKAHTIKGVAGYIGSSFLMNSARNLEEALKEGQREEAANHLIVFINALDETLSTLSALPALSEAEPVQELNSPGKVCNDREIEELLNGLIERLKKGEVAAEKQFAEVEKRLAGTGLDGQLKKIAVLIDDIEYDHAAAMTELLLASLLQQLEN